MYSNDMDTQLDHHFVRSGTTTTDNATAKHTGHFGCEKTLPIPAG